MQIKELVLYNYKGQRRQLPFNLGQLNIITGQSQTGKSVVGSIIDYCLGGQECNIADGVVRECVAWYGLLLQFDEDRIFVARQNPGVGANSTGACYYEVGKDIESPLIGNFVSNINYTGIEEILTKRLGIEENINIPQKDQTRVPLHANIRHSLFYCLQGQDEIAAKSYLFHRQAESFITQAIRDTMPYFLGAISGKAIEYEAERKEKRRELVRLSRELADIEDLAGRNSSRGTSLLSEAIRVGIADESNVDPTDFNALYDYLDKLTEKTDTELENENSQLTALQDERERVIVNLSRAKSDIDEAKRYQSYSRGFGYEANYQKTRLESIGLFEKLNFDSGRCPFCSSELSAPLVELDAIRKSIKELDNSIGSVAKEQPHIQKYIEETEAYIEELRSKRRAIESEINAIFESDERLEKIRDIEYRKAIVRGRISLWIESVSKEEDSSEIKEKVRALDARIHELDVLLSEENAAERIQSAMSTMQTYMTEWAKSLNLEGSGYPYRIDYSKATVVMDKDRPIPLKQMGSGSNWVGVHLIALFALQKYYIENCRPVPNFMFLDQPSQVYFPSMAEIEENKDLQAVSRIYSFIATQVLLHNGKLQVIVVDHAHLEDEVFRKHTIESWWDDDKKLVPLSWIKDKQKL